MSEVSSRLAGLTREERARLFDQLRKKGEPAAPPRPEPIPRRDPAAGPPPLSFSQQRLWFLDRLRPGETGAAQFEISLGIQEVSGVLFGALESLLETATLGELADLVGEIELRELDTDELRELMA